MSYRGWWMVMVMAGLLMSSESALAEGGRDTSDSSEDSTERPWANGVSTKSQERAFALLAAGNQFFDQKRYTEALPVYRRALGYWDHPAIRFNVARCLIHMEKWVDAYESMVKALAYDGAALEAKVLQQARSELKLLERTVSRVTVTVKQPGVRVTLNGTILIDGPGSATRVVLPGRHSIRATKTGHEPLVENLDARGGGEIERAPRLKLERKQILVKKRRWPRWVPYAVLASGAVVAAGAIPFHVRASRGFDDYGDRLSELCAPAGCSRDMLPADVKELESNAKRDRILAAAGYSLAGVGVIAGIVMLTMNQEHTEARVIAAPTKTGGIAGIQWSF